MNQDRRKIITSTINSGKYHTQDELLAALETCGLFLTQATLSRDLKTLGANKQRGHDGQSYYRVPIHNGVSSMMGNGKIVVSGQLCVVHCIPGFASAIASVLDNASLEDVLGTIAGDDTVLVMLDENADNDAIKDKITKILY